MSWITTSLLGAAATAGGAGIYRTIDNKTPDGCVNGKSDKKKDDKKNNNNKSGKEPEKRSVSFVGVTAVTTAVSAVTGSVNYMYSKHRADELKNKWGVSSNVIDERKIECAQDAISSLSDDELVSLLVQEGLLEAPESDVVKTI